MMFIFHFFVGALIGSMFGNFYIVAITSFISHFIFDIIPHYNEKNPNLKNPSFNEFVLIAEFLIFWFLKI